jgi:pSer/pThr/pTyr-binding forkhead associated (FHA) protein
MRAQLQPLDGGPTIDVVKDVMVVGRNASCDLRLEHKSVSKQHCVLVKTDGLVLLRDLGSTNGTRVNGQRVRRAALIPNDQLSIASFGFKLIIGPDQEPVSATDSTQHLDAGELSRLLAQRAQADEDDSSPELEVQVRINALPDVYAPNERPKVDE